jgi:hypothetical protein
MARLREANAPGAKHEQVARLRIQHGALQRVMGPAGYTPTVLRTSRIAGGPPAASTINVVRVACGS